MKSKNMTLMVVAIGCGLVAAFLTARLSGGSAPDTVDVIVAKKELVVGTVLDEKELESMLGTQKIAKANLPPDIINNAEDLKGKKLNRTLRAGNMFSATDVGADNGIKLPEGMSKYSVRTDMVKLASGFAQPGDKVDVILTESTSNGKAKSGIILRDMLLLSVDTPARRTEGGEPVQQVNSVSLAVTPKQSLILSSAEKRGEVKFLLRDPKDPDKAHIEVSTDIPGFDREAAQAQPAAIATKMVSVVIAKADVPVNTFVTQDNFDNFFTTKEVPEEGLSTKAIKDPATLREKYITSKMESDQTVFSSWLSEKKLEIAEVKPEMKPADPMVVQDGLETLPFPRELIPEKPLYPRKFVQIINNQSYYFLEIGPGEFRRVDGKGAELKDLRDTDSKPDKKDEKTDGTGGDIAT